MSLRSRASVLVVIALAFGASPAVAAPVAPGGGALVDSDTPDVVPAGTKVAEKVVPFTVVFPPLGDDQYVFQNTADGTLTSSVYRTAAGTLTFRYALDLEEIPYGSPTDTEVPSDEANKLTVRGFSGFSTDVTGYFGHSDFNVSRSADGASITGNIAAEGTGSPPVLIVETDATDFNDLGAARYEPAAEFIVRRPGDPSGEVRQVARDGFADIAGVFQPVVVPEPGSALTLLIGGAWLATARRRLAAGGRRFPSPMGKRCPPGERRNGVRRERCPGAGNPL
jgi:hypothetical protein